MLASCGGIIDAICVSDAELVDFRQLNVKYSRCSETRHKKFALAVQLHPTKLATIISTIFEYTGISIITKFFRNLI
jgi:hypothetical protein